MTDYITKSRARAIILKHGGSGAAPALRDIDREPAADVVPVVRGEWIWNDDNGYYYCEKCGAVSPRKDQNGEYMDCPNFCANCGAKMEAT